jgi:hypothetical protein
MFEEVYIYLSHLSDEDDVIPAIISKYVEYEIHLNNSYFIY